MCIYMCIYHIVVSDGGLADFPRFGHAHRPTEHCCQDPHSGTVRVHVFKGVCVCAQREHDLGFRF